MIHTHKKHYAWTSKKGKIRVKKTPEAKSSAAGKAELGIRVSVQLKEKKDPRKKDETKRMRNGDKENGEQARTETMDDAMLCACSTVRTTRTCIHSLSLPFVEKKRCKKKKTRSALDSSWAVVGAA